MSRARIAGLAAAASILLVVSACGNNPGPSVGTPSPVSTSAVLNVDFEHIPGEFPPQQPGIPGASLAPVGACVSLGGASTNATLNIVDCGSPAGAFKVIQRVSTPDQCPKDDDQQFYMNPEEGQFTACLDLAWSAADCLSIGKMTATRTACNSAEPKRERPLNVVLNSESANDCPAGGFAHPVRRFAICTLSQ